MEVPKPSERFKPIAHRDALSKAVRAAWEEKNDALEGLRGELKVGEVLASHLEMLYPPSDMAVLLKYGVAGEEGRIVVQIHTGDGYYNQSASVDLPRPVLVPWSKGPLYAGGPRYSEMPNLGVKAEKWEALTEEEQAKHLKHHEEKDKRAVPREIEPFFEALKVARDAYKKEWDAVSLWPANIKTNTGVYPTWQEIADAFPVVGAYLKKLWESEG